MHSNGDTHHLSRVYALFSSLGKKILIELKITLVSGLFCWIVLQCSGFNGVISCMYSLNVQDIVYVTRVLLQWKRASLTVRSKVAKHKSPLQ